MPIEPDEMRLIEKQILDIYRAVKGIQRKLLTLLAKTDKDKNNESEEKS